MSKIIRYRRALCGLKKDEVPLYRNYVCHNGTVGHRSFCGMVAADCGLKTPVVDAVLRTGVNTMIDNLQNGYRVELDFLSAFLTLPGLFDGANASQNPGQLVGHVVAKGDLRNCCKDADIVLQCETQTDSVYIRTVIDMLTRAYGKITKGSNVETHMTGSGIGLDPTNPSEGIWIAPASGTNLTVLAKADVIEATTTTLTCVFPLIDLEAGTYRICVASRNGRDAETYGVNIGTKKIEIVDAVAEGGV